MGISLFFPLFFFFLSFSAVLGADTQSYVVYLGAHTLRSIESETDAPEQVTDKHYEFLAPYVGSKENAEAAIFYSYTSHINGFAAQLNDQQVQELSKHPEVLSIFPNRPHPYHTTRTWEFLGLEHAGETPPYSLWKAADYGSDVIVANLDTGVWPESESFNDAGYGPVPARWKGVCQNSTDDVTKGGVRCNRKLIGARYFDKGYLSTGGQYSSQFHSPRDHEGHGTHTLSTAGGNFVRNASIFGFASGTAKGGAPKARVAAYKICWDSCYDADILAGFDAAINDGVDVISVSVGGGTVPYFQDGIAIGSFHAIKHGIAVVASAGNSGPAPGTIGNVSPWIFTVGASTLDRQFPAIVTLGNNISIQGQSLSKASLPKGFYPVASGVQVKTAPSDPQLAAKCITGSLDPIKTKGKIILCLRGNNSRVAKGDVVNEAGGVGMILYNDPATANEILADAHVVPAAHVTADAGNLILTYINSTKTPTAYINPVKTELDVKPAPVMAAFSSRGPNPINAEILKPDITAPGVSILAAYTEAESPTTLPFDNRRTKFNVESGTSMSCPHVAGIVALAKKIHPDWSPSAIKSAIMTTARNRDNAKKPIEDSSKAKATPFAYGAGHVRPNLIKDPGLVYDIKVTDYLNFLCALGYDSKSITVIYGEAYNCPGKVPALLDLNYPSITVPKMTEKVVVTRTLKNVGMPGNYSAQAVPPIGYTFAVSPTTLSFTKAGEEKSFTVTITPLRDASEEYGFGRLVWTDGIHTVRSTITVSKAGKV